MGVVAPSLRLAASSSINIDAGIQPVHQPCRLPHSHEAVHDAPRSWLFQPCVARSYVLHRSPALQLTICTICLDRRWPTLFRSPGRLWASHRSAYRLARSSTTTTRSTKATTMTSTTCCSKSKVCKASSKAYDTLRSASKLTTMHRRRSCIWRSRPAKTLWRG